MAVNRPQLRFAPQDNGAAELERFKREISLVGFAAAQGYVIDEAASTNATTVMRRGDKAHKDKIHISVLGGVYVYKHFAFDQGGTIIDLGRALGFSLGQLRQELRGWLQAEPVRNRAVAISGSVSRTPVPTLKPKLSSAQLLQEWAAMPAYTGTYLTERRGLKPSWIRHFGVRMDKHGNACFPHFCGGITGWELKNHDFGGFKPGGTKSVLLSTVDASHALRIVVTESAVDCVSFAQIGSQSGDILLSTGGTPSPVQKEKLLKIFAAHPSAQIVNAQDADLAGDQAASLISSLATGRDCIRMRPEGGKDWNDVLKNFFKVKGPTLCVATPPSSLRWLHA